MWRDAQERHHRPDQPVPAGHGSRPADRDYLLLGDLVDAPIEFRLHEPGEGPKDQRVMRRST